MTAITWSALAELLKKAAMIIADDHQEVTAEDVDGTELEFQLTAHAGDANSHYGTVCRSDNTAVVVDGATVHVKQRDGNGGIYDTRLHFYKTWIVGDDAELGRML